MAAKPNKKKQKPPTRAIPHNSTIRKFRIVEFSLNIAAGWMVKVYPLSETSSETCFARRNSHVPSARWTMLPDPFVRRLPLAAMMFLPVGSASGICRKHPPKGTLLALYPGHKRPDTWQKRPFPSNRKTAESARVRRPKTLGFRVSQGCPPLLAHVELELDDVAVLHDVVASLLTELAFLLDLDHGAFGGHEVVVGDDVGLMKPLSKSVWMTPAACGAVQPLWICQARTSLTPAVRKVCKRGCRSRRGRAGRDRIRTARRPPASRGRPPRRGRSGRIRTGR